MKNNKTIFWNVDTQYDFMRNDETFKGALPIAGAREIEGNLEKLTKFAEENKIKVVNTGDWHTLNSAEISANPDFKTTYPAHCIIVTNGAEFVPATNPENPYVVDWRQEKIDRKQIAERRNIIVYKDDFDVFEGNKYTDEILAIINPERAVVYGVATNVCVNFAVLGLLGRGLEVFVVEDAIKELPRLPFQVIINKWRNKGAVLKRTGEVADYLI